MLDRINSHYFE